MNWWCIVVICLKTPFHFEIVSRTNCGNNFLPLKWEKKWTSVFGVSFARKTVQNSPDIEKVPFKLINVCVVCVCVRTKMVSSEEHDKNIVSPMSRDHPANDEQCLLDFYTQFTLSSLTVNIQYHIFKKKTYLRYLKRNFIHIHCASTHFPNVENFHNSLSPPPIQIQIKRATERRQTEKGENKTREIK